MKNISFDELPDFTKKVESILGGDDGLAALQLYLAENPTKGDVIPKSHGLRKLRWRIEGGGKSGGARVIYFRWVTKNKITLCEMYTKNKKTNLNSAEIKNIRESLQ